MKTLPSHGKIEPRVLSEIINQIIAGDNNATNTITLDSGTSTIIKTADIRTEINPNSFISFMPKSSLAVAELNSNNMFVSEVKRGQFTITHSGTVNGLKFGVHITGGSNL